MKSVLSALLALLAPLASVAVESVLEPTAQMRVRYHYQEQGDVLTSDFEHQGRLGLKFRSGERFTSLFEFIHKSKWGEGTEELPLAAGTQVGIRNDDNSILVHQAYGEWLWDDDVQFKFGRQAIELSKGFVFSENSFSNTPYSFDSLLFQYDSNFAGVNFWMIQKNDADPANGIGDDPERTILLLSVEIKSLPALIKKAHIHIGQDNSQELSTPLSPSKDISRYGLLLDGSYGPVIYNLTYAAESGEEVLAAQNTTVAATMGDVTLGYQTKGLWKFALKLNYHTDTGDSDNNPQNIKRDRYDPYFYDQHKFAGLMDAFKWGNLTYFGINLDAEPREQMHVGINFLQFSKTMAADTTVHFFGSEVLGITETDLGNEIEVYIEQQISEGFHFSAHIGVLQSQNTALLADDIIQGFMQTRWNF